MRNNTILFTGLVRNESLFIDKLQKCLSLRAEGFISNIIVSTWRGELKRYPRLRNVISESNVLVVNSEEPNLKLPGHLLHQMKAFYVGLSVCEDNAYVYKMRSDIGTFDVPSVTRILKGDYCYSVDASGGWPKFFSERIVIESALVCHPFYMNDIQFYGAKPDLLKMVNCDLFYEMVYIKLAPEQFFHIKSFSGLRIFDEYFKFNQGLFHTEKEKNIKFHSLISESSFLQKVIAVYWLILFKYYYFRSGGLHSRKFEGAVAFDDLFQGKIPQMKLMSDRIPTPVCGGFGWFAELFESGLVTGGLKNIFKYVSEFSDFKRLQDYEISRTFSQDVEKYYSDLEKKLGAVPKKGYEKSSAYELVFSGPNLRASSTLFKFKAFKRLEVILNKLRCKFQDVIKGSIK